MHSTIASMFETLGEYEFLLVLGVERNAHTLDNNVGKVKNRDGNAQSATEISPGIGS